MPVTDYLARVLIERVDECLADVPRPSAGTIRKYLGSRDLDVSEAGRALAGLNVPPATFWGHGFDFRFLEPEGFRFMLRGLLRDIVVDTICPAEADESTSMTTDRFLGEFDRPSADWGIRRRLSMLDAKQLGCVRMALRVVQAFAGYEGAQHAAHALGNWHSVVGVFATQSPAYPDDLLIAVFEHIDACFAGVPPVDARSIEEFRFLLRGYLRDLVGYVLRHSSTYPEAALVAETFLSGVDPISARERLCEQVSRLDQRQIECFGAVLRLVQIAGDETLSSYATEGLTTWRLLIDNGSCARPS